MNIFKIDDIRKLVSEKKIRWTNHIVIRLLQRNITQEDVENAIMSGEIIEEYINDYPYPSCLIYGVNINGSVLHVVCGIGENELWLITAYYPDLSEWKENLKVRKGK